MDRTSAVEAREGGGVTHSSMLSHSLTEIGTELGMRYSRSSSSMLIASAERKRRQQRARESSSRRAKRTDLVEDHDRCERRSCQPSDSMYRDICGACGADDEEVTIEASRRTRNVDSVACRAEEACTRQQGLEARL